MHKVEMGSSGTERRHALSLNEAPKQQTMNNGNAGMIRSLMKLDELNEMIDQATRMEKLLRPSGDKGSDGNVSGAKKIVKARATHHGYKWTCTRGPYNCFK